MQLYPLGTKLTTRRLSQISLYLEIFGDSEITSCWPDDKGAALIPALDNDPIRVKGFDPSAVWWEVVITTENQKWLSPVPMTKDTIPEGHIVGVASLDGKPIVLTFGGGYHFLDLVGSVENRIYPNGRRAPLIEWDEVQEPENA